MAYVARRVLLYLRQPVHLQHITVGIGAGKRGPSGGLNALLQAFAAASSSLLAAEITFCARCAGTSS
jgi:hypothetical protein